MKLSVMYELFTPQPMDVDAEHRIIQQTLDQIELADKLGFRAAWAVEHHFLEEYAHSSAPEVLLAAASQRTTRIRLGHGIVNTVPAINHPFRVAERVSTPRSCLEGARRVRVGRRRLSRRAGWVRS